MMSSDLTDFGRLITSLAPWLDQLVIIGGWAHRLYREHPDAQALDYEPLTTLDTDIALPSELAPAPQDIQECLASSGFKEEFVGNAQPPATHYRLSGGTSGFYAEFLTPLVGSLRDRNARSKATAQIAGITCQRLRDIEILLIDPWSVDLSLGSPQLPEPVKVKIANPVSFLAQKVLIHKKRSGADRAKDILYLHDTLETFGSRLPELRSEWSERIAPKLHPKALRTIRGASAALFSETSDPIRNAAMLPVGRTLSAEMIREVCHVGFTEIFT